VVDRVLVGEQRGQVQHVLRLGLERARHVVEPRHRALDEPRALGHQLAPPGGEVVQHDDFVVVAE
jgi:hypothetical protein